MSLLIKLMLLLAVDCWCSRRGEAKKKRKAADYLCIEAFVPAHTHWPIKDDVDNSLVCASLVLGKLVVM